jgi:hypothetical protein
MRNIAPDQRLAAENAILAASASNLVAPDRSATTVATADIRRCFAPIIRSH